MRRSISYTEPKTALAGESNTWKFLFSPGSDLPKGTQLKFDLESKGRAFDWQFPQTAMESSCNLIWLSIPGHKESIPAKAITSPKGNLPQFEFILPEDVKAGDTLSILLGSPDGKTSGNTAQTYTRRRRPFSLYIDPKGNGEYKDPETFYMDVRGNALHSIRVIIPSIVTKNQRFDVIIRFEDLYGNLTSNAPEGTLVEFSYNRIRENIRWRLFVPETGFLNLPNLYFNEEGIYHIQLKNLSTNEIFFSTPIKCLSKPSSSIFWGTFHAESELYNTGSDIETFLRYYRDEKAFQFFSTSSFESEEETPSDIWKTVSSHIAEFNEDERFTTFLGMQWCGVTKTEGLRQLIYLKDNKPILRRKESKASHLKKIYKGHTSKELLSIPSFTMGSTTCYDFESFSPEYEKVVEIYNAWGSSECGEDEGNPRPITCKGKNGVKETKEGSIRNALNRNYRFGFVAGGHDDRGVFSSFFDSSQVQYSPGITAILTNQQTRDAVIQALHKRSCYATTGARIILGFFIAHSPIGSELNLKTKPGLSYNRHLTGYVVGTAPIKEVLIIRNGHPFFSHNPKETFYDFAIDDSDPFSSIALHPPHSTQSSFAYYYLRVIQQDGHIAWSSPIWVDEANPATEKKKKGS